MKVYNKELQADGNFNNGEILEKKPLGFPQDGGILKPYSNLFYWAYGWSEKGSTIGLHPHQGFEIMTFVLEGEVSHFDTKIQQWRNLKKGDAQIIRAGNGISHAERIHAGAHYFQIWFDPDLSRTLSKPASYNDYISEGFPVTKVDGQTIKTYVGKGSPVVMDTPGLEIKEIEFKKGIYTLQLSENKNSSVFILKGALIAEKNKLNNGDFFIHDKENLELEIKQDCSLFIIESPIYVEYKTYAEQYLYENR